MARIDLSEHIPHPRPDSAGRILFQLCMWGFGISSILQVAYDKIPQSISGISPAWFDFAYQAAQLFSCILVLVGIYWREACIGLTLERAGCVLGLTVGVIYGISVSFQNSGPPLSSGVWIVLALSFYMLLRAARITKTFRVARKERR